MIVMTRAERQSLENQTVIMGALAVVMDFVKINVAELRVGAGLQRVRLTDALAATRNLTEGFPEPPGDVIAFAASGAPPFAACPGCGGPDHCARTGACASPSGALAEANANRAHLRSVLRDRDTERAALEAVLIREGYQPPEATRMASVLFGVAGAN